MKTNLFLPLLLISCLITSGLQGCASAWTRAHDYQTYLEHMPRSILVLPPVNKSTEVMAPYIYLSTVTRPLAERGYYVFPVAVIDAMMKENGVSMPEDMAQISLDKIREIINPDAVLYLTIIDWGTKYQVIDSYSIVHVQGRLVDVSTGGVLWEGERAVRQNSSSGQSSFTGMLVAALANQIVQSIVDPTRDIALATNSQLFLNENDGLLLGARHREYEADQTKRRDVHNQNRSKKEGDGEPKNE